MFRFSLTKFTRDSNWTCKAEVSRSAQLPEFACSFSWPFHMSSEYHIYIYILYIYSYFYIYIYIHMNLVLSDSTKFRESADCLIQLSATTTSTTEGLFSRQIFPPLQAPVPTGVLADGCKLLQGLRDIRRW
jgi:hypothetical protein